MMLKFLSRVALIVQLGLSVFLMKLILDFNFLPYKYSILLGAVLLVIWFFNLFLQRRPRAKKSKNGTKRKNHGKTTSSKSLFSKRKMLLREKVSMILVIINCIILVLGNYYIYLSTSTLDEITDIDKTVVHTINVRVMADSSYETLEDLVGQEIEFCIGSDTNDTAQYTSEYINILQNDHGLETGIADNFSDLAADLYDGNTAAIVIDTVDEIYLSAYDDQLQSDNQGIATETYQELTRVIASYEIEVEDENPDTTVPPVNTSTTVPEVMNVFVSGIDTYGSISTVSRSDVNMILTINFETHEILMTGIPRDYYVTLHTYQEPDKLTHAGLYGAEESVATIEDLMGIDIDYYIRVNFSSVIDIVNALDGIDFYNPKTFTAVGTYYMPEGEIHLNGKQALYYSRERHTLSGGDNDRIANQQRIISAIIDKAISPSIIANYPSLLEAGLSAMQTNMSTGLITNIIKAQLNEGGSWNLQHQYLEGTPSRSTHCYSSVGYNLYVTLPDQDSIDEANENIEKVTNGITVTFDNESSYVNSNDTAN